MGSSTLTAGASVTSGSDETIDHLERVLACPPSDDGPHFAAKKD
jgi:hypothetical protein